MPPPPTGGKKARLDKIQVIELNRHNFNSIWPYLLVSLKEADLVAIDLEMSGLGSKAGLRAKSIEDRYRSIRDAAITRSILSIGIAIFKKESCSGKKKRIKYSSQVFNILSLDSAPFTIEPDCLEFLARHKFDFNKLIQDGVQYYPIGWDKPCPLRSLFDEIFRLNKPLSLHNGWMDLCYIYQHFYAQLPEKLSEFVCDVSELFPPSSPLIDSKYLAEFSTRMKASYLEYVFRKCQRDNMSDSLDNKVFLDIRFANVEKMMGVIREATDSIDCSLPLNFPNHQIPIDIRENICDRYMNHGFCGVKSCVLLHDVDFALDLESGRSEKEKKRRKRRFDHILPESLKDKEGGESTDGESARESVTVKELTQRKTRVAVHGCHRAGVDAFMTGFAVLFQCRMSLFRNGNLPPELCSRLPLSGKDVPLLLQKSQFANCSEMHSKKILHINAARRKLMGLESVENAEGLEKLDDGESMANGEGAVKLDEVESKANGEGAEKSEGLESTANGKRAKKRKVEEIMDDGEETEKLVDGEGIENGEEAEKTRDPVEEKGAEMECVEDTESIDSV